MYCACNRIRLGCLLLIVLFVTGHRMQNALKMRVLRNFSSQTTTTTTATTGIIGEQRKIIHFMRDMCGRYTSHSCICLYRRRHRVHLYTTHTRWRRERAHKTLLYFKISKTHIPVEPEGRARPSRRKIVGIRNAPLGAKRTTSIRSFFFFLI